MPQLQGLPSVLLSGPTEAEPHGPDAWICLLSPALLSPLATGLCLLTEAH